MFLCVLWCTETGRERTTEMLTRWELIWYVHIEKVLYLDLRSVDHLSHKILCRNLCIFIWGAKIKFMTLQKIPFQGGFEVCEGKCARGAYDTKYKCMVINACDFVLNQRMRILLFVFKTYSHVATSSRSCISQKKKKMLQHQTRCCKGMQTFRQWFFGWFWR